MGGVYINAVQILHIRFIADGALHILQHRSVLLLEHFRILTFAALCITIFFNFVDEKQAEYLDALPVQFTLPLDMGADGFAYLDAPLQCSHLCTAVNLAGV